MENLLLYVCMYVGACVGGRVLYIFMLKKIAPDENNFSTILKINYDKDGTMWKIPDVMLREKKCKISNYVYKYIQSHCKSRRKAS